LKRGVSYEEALEILSSSGVRLKGEEKLFLHDALGRVLARDIIAPSDMPPFPTAAMDGYACSSRDINEGRVLRIAGDNPAGNPCEMALEEGSCIKTFTGARMPRGADTLLIVENVKEEEGFLKLTAPAPRAGVFIRQAGDNYRQGEILLPKGTLLTPSEIGLLASLNHLFVHVRSKPIVTILSGGDELVELGEESLRVGALRSANNHLLKALIDSMGGEARLTDLLPDEPHAIEEALKSALEESDIVLTTGGMSLGDYDFTQQAIYKLCDEVLFHGAKVKPGKPIAYAKKGDTHLFGLPGFPNSCLITFYLFGRIILHRILGVPFEPLKIRAKLDESLQKEAGRAEFRVCTLKLQKGEWRVDFEGKKGIQSAIINNLCGPTALVILDEECTFKERGEEVEVVLFKPLETILQRS